MSQVEIPTLGTSVDVVSTGLSASDSIDTFPALAGPQPLVPDLTQIQQSALASWPKGDRTVYYCGSDRYEVLIDSSAIIQPDIKRDWKKELLELRQQLEKERANLLYTLPIEYLEEKLQATTRRTEIKLLQAKIEELHKVDITTEKIECSRRRLLFDYGMDRNIAEFPGIERMVQFQQGLKKIMALTELVPKIQEKIENDFLLAQQVFLDRQELIREVEDIACLISDQVVHIYLNDECMGGGILGQAKILARSLRALAPQLSVKIFAQVQAEGGEVFHPMGWNDGIQLISIKSDSEIIQQLPNSRIHFYRGVPENLFNQVSESGDFLVPLTGAPGLSLREDPNGLMETHSKYYSNPMTMFVQDPYGVLPFDLTLAERGMISNNIDLPSLISQRESWLEEAVGSVSSNLLQHAKDGNWNLASSVWSWAYFRDPDAFLAEMKELQDALLDEDFDKECLFVPDAEQIVIFAAQSRYLERPINPAEWVELGFSVVLESGEVLNPPESIEKVPVTIVLHSGFENNKVRELVSELVGSCKKVDGSRIKFPVYVTGCASFYEAISAGQIAVHDNVDQAPGLMRSAIERLCWRLAATTNVKEEEVEPFVHRATDGMLMGHGANKNRYLDLQSWSNEASRFTDNCLVYNCVYDVLAGIAKVDINSRLAEDPHT